VQRTLIRPPHSRMGKATVAERTAVLENDPNMKRYGKAYDPRSAHEVLLERTAASLKQSEQAELEQKATKNKPNTRSSSRQSSSEAFFKSLMRSLGSAVGSTLGRKLFRGLLGSLLK
jgi:hypothetical protein